MFGDLLLKLLDVFVEVSVDGVWVCIGYVLVGVVSIECDNGVLMMVVDV